MTGDQFTGWLVFMRLRKLALSDARAAELLGVHPNTIVRWKANGAPLHVALACQALLDGLPPFKLDTASM